MGEPAAGGDREQTVPPSAMPAVTLPALEPCLWGGGTDPVQTQQRSVFSAVDLTCKHLSAWLVFCSLPQTAPSLSQLPASVVHLMMCDLCPCSPGMDLHSL